VAVEAPTFNRRAPDPILDVHIRLATPMLGGGAEAKKPDVDEPFRPTAVRNGIRHWWRRVYLAHYAGGQALPDLRKAEAAVWGSTENPGLTTIAVQSRTDSQPVRLDKWQHLERVGYACNLLLDRNAPENNPFLLPRAEGRLQIWAPSCSVHGLPDNFDNVQILKLAAQLWLLFGGVGARTRRGFGVLTWDGLTPNWEAIRGLIKPGGPSYPLSVLRGAQLFVHDKKADALSAWAASLKPYADFRKGNLPGAAQRDHHGPDSHSQWPEADAVRLAQRRPPKTHQNLPSGRFPVPRAALGLPMTLHFGRGHGADDDVLEYGDGGRFPSPVITRPIRKDGQWLPCILVLRAPLPDGQQIRWKSGRQAPFDLNCSGWPARWWGQGMETWDHGAKSATDAFVTYLKAKAKWRGL
jgi:CRISPR-associated protein Cmr1